MKKINSFKAFDSDLKCRGFQFEVGKEYSEVGGISACNKGFHACENPFNVLDFYPLPDSRFCEVEQYGKIDKEYKKIASEKIIIKAEINLAGFIKACFKYVYFSEKDLKIIDKLKGRDKTSSGYGTQHASSGHSTQHASSGHSTQHASSGHSTKHASSGHSTQHASSGYSTQHASSGDYTKHASSGYSTQHASSGHSTQHASSGHSTKHASSGHSTQHASSGDYTKHASSGDYTKHASSGHHSVIVSSGINSKAKGCKGTLICLTHFVEGKPAKFTTGKVGEKGLKEDVYYTLNSDGEFTEC